MGHYRKSLVFALLILAASICKDASISLYAQNNGKHGKEVHSAGSRLGIGFLWTAETESVAEKLISGKDFVDVILGPGKLDIFEKGAIITSKKFHVDFNTRFNVFTFDKINHKLIIEGESEKLGSYKLELQEKKNQ